MDERRTAFLQIAFVVAIALGAGLFAFGGYLEPPLDHLNPGEMVRLSQHPQTRSEEHYIASGSRGCGIGLMTLGGLGLVVPWVNLLVGRLAGRECGAPERDVSVRPGG